MFGNSPWMMDCHQFLMRSKLIQTNESIVRQEYLK